MVGQFKVRVIDGWAVFADGAQRNGGETLELDADMAERWAADGWVTVVADKTRRPARRPARDH